MVMHGTEMRDLRIAGKGASLRFRRKVSSCW